MHLVVRICEHDNAELSCDAGSVLQIVSADYGRVDNRRCRNGLWPVNGPQMNPINACRHDVTGIVKGW